MKNKGMLLIAAGVMLLLAETAQAQLIGGPSRISIRNPFLTAESGSLPGARLRVNTSATACVVTIAFTEGRCMRVVCGLPQWGINGRRLGRRA